VLVGSDCTWGHCICVIGALTQFWGGAACAVVPTDGQSISPLFWQLLKRYDPDWVVRYGDTVEVADSLWADLSARLSLAQPLGDHLDVIWPDNVGWPLTGVHQCLPDNEAITPVRDLRVKGDPLAQTLVYASAGYLHKRVRGGLESAGVEVKEEEVHLGSGAGGLLQLADDLWMPRHRRTDAQLPLWLSLRYLGPYTTDPTDRPAIVAVCGDTLDDFAFFWTLRALRGAFVNPNVFWIARLHHPDAAQDDINKLRPYVAHAVTAQLEQVYGDKRVLATSVSMPSDSLDNLGALLDKTAFVPRHDATKSAVVQATDLDQLCPYETNYWELNNTPGENASVVQFLEGEGLAILNTPVPKKMSVAFGSDMRWMVDVEVEGLRLPARSSLTPLVVETVPMGAFRVSRHGIAYQAISALLLTYMSVESMVIRPRLKLPTDWQVFQALAHEAGLTLALSDKGQFERELIRMVGGLEALGKQLRHPKILGTLLRFIDQTPNKQGVFDEGDLIDQRRYLDLVALGKLWDGDDDAATRLADKYLQDGLFQRGMLVKCPHCRKADWYRLAELSDTVTCHRCSRDHVFSAAAAVWFRLDEVAREALKQGSQIPLLTLDYLRRRSRVSFLFSTACEIRRHNCQDAKPWLEADLLAVADGRLVVGESKRGKKLAAADREQLGRYVDLCRALRTDAFVVSTDATEWSRESTTFLDKLERQLAGIDVELVRPTGVDIGWPPATGDHPVDLGVALGAQDDG
jgi:hypothetical protein